MARKVVESFVSDLSGEEIDPKDAWVMELTPPDARSNKVRLDISSAEAEAFRSKGTEIRRRGRRPGSKNKSATANPDPKPSGNGRRRKTG